MEDEKIFLKLDKIAKKMFTKELIKLIIEEKYISLDDNPRKDWGADSLDEYEMLYKIEEEFGITISDGDPRLREIETVQEMMDYLKNNYQLS